MTPISRRQFGSIAGGAIAALAAAAACHGSEVQVGRDGRLTARPRRHAAAASGGGTRPLGLDASRDGRVLLPNGAGPHPLVVLLHGAGGTGAGILRRLESFAAAAGVAVLAPDSRRQTWDVIEARTLGPDVVFLNRALEHVFETGSIDPARVAIGGFSDGASYALSLGLINGDLFERIIAFSPGFYVGGEAHGRPRIFVTHGTADPILPIDRCSRPIVAGLKKQGYDVTFRQFDGGHEIPPQLAAEGLKLVAQAR